MSKALQQQAPCSLNISLSEVGLQLTYACLLCSADGTVVNVAVTGLAATIALQPRRQSKPG